MNNLIIKNVVKEKDFYKAEIENNPFYPDGKGGQLGDRGTISEIKVIEVYENSVLLEKEISSGSHSYVIDKSVREDISQQHTGQHILSAAFEELGNIHTVGFRMSDIYSTIDIDLEILSEKFQEDVEKLANKKIYEMIPVSEIITDLEGSKNFKLRKPLSDKITGEVRLIKIGEFDISACGGFHVENTAQVQMIKIISKERVKGGLTRLYFLCGNRVFCDYSKKNELLKNISNQLTTSVDSIEAKIKSMNEELSEMKKQMKKNNEQYSELYFKELINNSEQINNYKIIKYDKKDQISELFFQYLSEDQILLTGENGEFAIYSKNFKCKEFVSEIIKKYPVKGGGSDIRGNIKGTILLENIIEELKNAIK